MDASQSNPPTPQPYDDCPDPTEPYTKYRVDAAVAQEASRLFVADTAVVGPKFGQLDGAQGRFATNKAAQRAAFEELTQRVERIASTLNCELSEEVREHLRDCWEDLNEETAPPTATTDCTDVDDVDCDNLPDEIARLRELVDLAAKCVTRVDADFDALAGLPDRLGPEIAGLQTDATALEQEVCAVRSDMPRSFVEYLKLKQRFDVLHNEWTTPAAYGCKLKALFVTLLHRHVVAICLKLEIFRRDTWDALAEEVRQAKAKNLVDLVLECARPKHHEGGNGQPPPRQYEETGGYQTRTRSSRPET